MPGESRTDPDRPVIFLIEDSGIPNDTSLARQAGLFSSRVRLTLRENAGETASYTQTVQRAGQKPELLFVLQLETVNPCMINR